MSTVAIQRAPTPTALTRSLYGYMNDLYNKIEQRAFNMFEAKGQIHGRDLEDHYALLETSRSESPSGESLGS
jgi:hypothetical protein